MILLTATIFESGQKQTLIEKIAHIRTKKVLFRNKVSTVMISPGPAFKECTQSCHENVPALTSLCAVGCILLNT